MDPHAAQYQQPPPPQLPPQNHHYHHQTYDPSSSSSSQIQPYTYDQNNPANQSYYSSNQYYHSYYDYYQQQQQPYTYQTQPDYTNSYNYNYQQPPQQQEDTSIYPPGVEPTVPTTTTYTAAGAVGGHHNQSGGPGMSMVPLDPLNVVGGASLDNFASRDMKHHLPVQHYTTPQGVHHAVQPTHASTSVSVRKAVKGHGRSAKVRPQPMAWCELCRVDCNSLEVLEQHKNGKKHKKNLKTNEELQKLYVIGQNQQGSVPAPEAGTDNHFQKVEGSGANLPAKENLSAQDVPEEEVVETVQQKTEERENKEESKEETRSNNFESREHGLKRKMKGGRGGKRMKSYDGSRRPIEPPKPKEIVPLICELCNVKCESPVVFQSHLTGKKHLTNLKRFQGQQTMLGQAALQALYPALQALVPALQELCQGDIYALISQLQQQGALVPQAVFAQQGPPVVSHSQASGAAPEILSALPELSAVNQGQDDVQLEGSKAEGGSQSTSPTDGKSHGQSTTENRIQSDPVPDSNEAVQSESKTAESVG